jgi:type II secretory pathway pseudopilin PulG
MANETLIAILLVAVVAAMMVWSFLSDGDDDEQ